MDRVIVYPGQIPLETDILNTNKFTMLALGRLAAAAVGNSDIAEGLLVTQTTSPGLSVKVGPGSMYSSLVVDGSAYSSLAADTTNSIMKQGVNLGDVTLGPVTLPSGSNKQVCAVVASISSTDTDNTVLPYYNAASPSTALNGPGGAGTSQPRTRKTALTLSLKYGTATTGTPVAPSLAAGEIGLAQCELRSTTTQITASAQSSTNAQICNYNASGYTGGTDPRSYAPYASLSKANIFQLSQVILGTLTVSSTVSTGADATSSAHVPRLSQFATSSGTLSIPTPAGAVILKWGNATVSANGVATAVTFGTAFPTACRAVVIVPSIASASTISAWQDNPSAAGFNARQSGTGAIACQWLAIGD